MEFTPLATAKRSRDLRLVTPMDELYQRWVIARRASLNKRAIGGGPIDSFIRAHQRKVVMSFL